MRVQFFSDSGDLVCTRIVEGEDDFDVCDRAWQMIESGEIEADDFQIVRTE